MNFYKLIPFGLILTISAGCFEAQDIRADKAMARAVQDSKMMLQQDEAFERDRLRQAESAGLKLIEEKRQTTGKSLENLKGPDGMPLLNWSNATLLNEAFDQLRDEFQRAVAGLDIMITAKYQSRMTPIQVTESYLDYIQVRRHAGEYVAAGFLEEMAGFSDGKNDVAANIEKLKSLGLPTSLDELSSWLSEKAGSILSGVLSQSPTLSGNVKGFMSLFNK